MCVPVRPCSNSATAWRSSALNARYIDALVEIRRLVVSRHVKGRELQPGAGQPVVYLRHGVGAILCVQEHIDERRVTAIRLIAVRLQFAFTG